MSKVSDFEEKEEKGFTRWIGYFEGEVIAINPNLSQLAGLGMNLKEEPVYVKQVEDEEKEITQVTATFYIKNIKSGLIIPARFTLRDKLRTKKDDGEKKQFINDQGNSGWGYKEEDLPSFITNKGQEVRQAHAGEADLYDFIRTWMNKVDWEKAPEDYKIYFDWKKLIKGDFRDISALMDKKYMKDATLLIPAIVKMSQDGSKEYQQIFNKGIGAGWLIKQIDKLSPISNEIKNESLKVVKAKDKNNRPSNLQKVIAAIADVENGCKDSYFLGSLKEYDAKKNFVASGEAMPSVLVDDYSDDDISY